MKRLKKCGILSRFHRIRFRLRRASERMTRTANLKTLLRIQKTSPDRKAALRLLRDYVKDLIHELSPREQKILEMRFGLNDGVSHTLEEVGQEFDVTRERIRQIEAKALEKIKASRNIEKLEDY